jgi:hypothetical protein
MLLSAFHERLWFLFSLSAAELSPISLSESDGLLLSPMLFAFFWIVRCPQRIFSLLSGACDYTVAWYDYVLYLYTLSVTELF